jgi:hypothetical protein
MDSEFEILKNNLIKIFAHQSLKILTIDEISEKMESIPKKDTS